MVLPWLSISMNPGLVLSYPKLPILSALSATNGRNQCDFIIGVYPFMVLGIIVVYRYGHGGYFFEFRIIVGQKFLQLPNGGRYLSARHTGSGDGKGGTSHDFLGN